MVSLEPTPTNLGSPERFGYQWNKYADLLPEYEEQFLGWTVHLKPEDWAGRRFLDAGCGMGRNSYWPMTYGAAGGRAIDLDPRSLASARRTLARFQQVVVEEASIYDIAPDSSFDIVFSIGVIHHLEFPARALAAMAGAAKPGGQVLIWVYGQENNRWLLVGFDKLRRILFSWLPIRIVHHLSLYLTALLWVFLRLGLGHLAYFGLIRKFSFGHLRSIVFDHMLPKTSNYWRRDEVEALMREAGLVDIRLEWVNQISWSAIGRRPG